MYKSQTSKFPLQAHTIGSHILPISGKHNTESWRVTYPLGRLESNESRQSRFCAQFLTCLLCCCSTCNASGVCRCFKIISFSHQGAQFSEISQFWLPKVGNCPPTLADRADLRSVVSIADYVQYWLCFTYFLSIACSILSHTFLSQKFHILPLFESNASLHTQSPRRVYAERIMPW